MHTLKYLLKEKKYQLNSFGHGLYEGNLIDVTKRAMDLGINQTELTKAYTVMAEQKNTVAEFGMMNTFMFSHNNDSKEG